MKLEEIKAAMLRGETFAPLFEEFKIALKRVRDNYNKCQHCYVTAAELSVDQYENACTLITYGMENFAEVWSDYYRANVNLAILSERAGKYREAKNAYLAALSALETSPQKSDYVPELSSHLLRVEMHLFGFLCTDDLLTYYEQAITDHSLIAGTRKSLFYRYLAEIIIAQRNQDKVASREATRKAKFILNGENASVVSDILKKHRYKDEAQATEEAIQFLYQAQ